MSAAVVDDLVLGFVALLVSLLAMSMFAIFKPVRPAPNRDATVALDALIVTFESEVLGKARAKAAARESAEMNWKDIRAEYEKRRTGWVQPALRVWRSWK